MFILSSDIFSHLLLSSIYLTSTSVPFSLSGHPSSSLVIYRTPPTHPRSISLPPAHRQRRAALPERQPPVAEAAHDHAVRRPHRRVAAVVAAKSPKPWNRGMDVRKPCISIISDVYSLYMFIPYFYY